MPAPEPGSRGSRGADPSGTPSPSRRVRADDGYAIWTARWTGGMSAEVRGRGHLLRTDEPPQFGGGDSGPMPTELLAAALASCLCMALAWAARRRDLTLGEIEVDVRPHRAERAPRHGAYDVWVRADAPPDRLEALLELAKRVCWVSNTLATPPEIRYRLGSPDGDRA